MLSSKRLILNCLDDYFYETLPFKSHKYNLTPYRTSFKICFKHKQLLMIISENRMDGEMFDEYQ